MSTTTKRTSVAATVVVFMTLALFSTPGAVAEQSVAIPVIHVEGRGHGHGVGMSQWGAFTMAQQGASAADIIAAFYPGTALAQRGGEVVVGIDRRARVRIQLPAGGEIRSARGGGQHPGFPVSVAPGGVVEIVRDQGGYRVIGGAVAPLDASSRTRYSPAQECFLVLCSPDEEPPDSSPPPTTAPDGGNGDEPTPPRPAPGPTPQPAPGADPQPAPPPPEAQPDDPVSPTPVWAVAAGGNVVRSVDRGRSYRGLFEVAGDPGSLRVRNHVDIEQYLEGMAEVPGSWPAAAVQAQAIAARTYALRAMATAGELCDTESCQVYAGTAHESAGQSAAVAATRNTVVTHGGNLASTFYSASGGGFSANVTEGFGTASDVPYLQARPYPTVRPDEWSVDVALSDVARRLGYGGRLTAVSIDEVGPSGRAVRMTLHGDAGSVGVDPQDFRRRLGLRSTLFQLATAEVQEAPAPPPTEVVPDVVGVDAGSAPEAPFAEIRRPRSGGAVSQLAIPPAPTDDGGRFPLLAATVAFVLLVSAWTALTLQTMAVPLRWSTRLSGWTNRSR